ncbi:MAG: DUF2442 domain-containing protein [Flavobacteriales bacterium]|jgi:hypothetical protein
MTLHNINHIDFDELYMYLQSDDKSFRIPLAKTSLKFQEANSLQREFFTISPSAYCILWPLNDEDLAVEARLRHTA